MQRSWQKPRVFLFANCLLTVMVALILARPSYVCAQGKPAGNSGDAQISKAVGTIKSIQADSITVAAESGGEGDVIAKLMGSTKILRVPPGEKDLKNATALQAQDLQPGDRVLVRGQASTDGDRHMIVALSVIVMKQADVAAKQQHDRDDWQKRGVGGLVTKVDAATGAITISSSGTGATRSITVVVHIAKDTILRRYAPDSVKFDDAKPAPASQFMAQIKAGDQLRARGTRNSEGSEVSAEEVVSGTFRNIAGTIKSIDAASNTMTVQDAIRKSAVVVKVSPDSQMKKLPAEMAQRIAMRLKGTAGGGNGDQPGANGQGLGQGTTGQGAVPSAGGARPGTETQTARGPGGGQGGNGPPDLQRMLSRLPNSTLADLQKGDAVMIVSTEGGDSGGVTAITLLAGVDAILTAATSQSASTLLSPWSLGASTGEGEAAQQ
jgi:transcription antitermination factor NusG